MIIKVLGSGCASCQKLEENTREALAQAGLEATIEKVTDYPAIMQYNIMRTPALVVDEKVVVKGRVPTAAAIADLLTAATP